MAQVKKTEMQTAEKLRARFGLAGVERKREGGIRAMRLRDSWRITQYMKAARKRTARIRTVRFAGLMRVFMPLDIMLVGGVSNEGVYR